MPEFTASTLRIDPYKNFRFRVKWDGAYVAAFSKISGLRRTTEVIKYRAGGDPGAASLLPGQTSWDAITLERGVTHDPAFEQWANKLWQWSNAVGDRADEISRADFRKDITLELYNEAGQKVIAYTVYRCWPSEFQAIPELDASADGVAIETLVLQNEGFVRDMSVAQPTELSFTEPES